MPAEADAAASKDEKSAADTHCTFLKLVLAPWTTHFKSPGYIKDSLMQKLDVDICKKILQRTSRDAVVQRSLALDQTVWEELGILFEAAIPSLEKRSFPPADPTSPHYDTAPGSLIASNCTSLLKDLERLNDLIAIARNILTAGEAAQTLARESGFDQWIFNVINVCVKVTARGYDGDSGAVEEERGQLVINSYKKLLITALQFLNNLVAQNERGKLMLWVELFDNSAEKDDAQPDAKSRPDIWANFEQSSMPLLSGGSDLFGHLDASPTGVVAGPRGGQPSPRDSSTQRPSSPFLLYLGKESAGVRKQLVEKGDKADPTEVAAECERRWLQMSEEDRQRWHALYDDIIAKYRYALSSSKLDPEKLHGSSAEALLARTIQHLQLDSSDPKKFQALHLQNLSGEKSPSSISSNPGDAKKNTTVPIQTTATSAAAEADYRMTYTASYGADILQRGKDDLMKRLESFSGRTGQPPPLSTPPQRPPPVDPSIVDPVAGHVEPPLDLSDEESEEDDYAEVGDDGRGLLTDVPLILAPAEIEVLPMIIMSGIVPPTKTTPGYGSTLEEMNAIRTMHMVRCHLLLAQDNGRNLLRELLIFVAAWDLREDELYYKFMVKIMEAILANGLMPFSYHAFRETKDIISPAQAVIMKLLTNIFRSRQSASIKNKNGKATDSNAPMDAYPPKVDVHLVNFLFTEFRRQIIPQTCALIFLQGQIRARNAFAEDFPLNLWDMERMYEGVYQYLEFFAIMTEHPVWKGMMADWDLTSELVTLLKELDAAIPKKQPTPPAANRADGSEERLHIKNLASAAPVSVERPYDRSAPTMPMTVPEPPAEHEAFTDDTPEDASEFEWRNLKKLAVLVLSSLVWKSRAIQDQARAHGGVEAVLACTAYDEHNPYIREHAIMCLRFLTEANPDNQDRIRALEARAPVPSEVLDSSGYETIMDEHGQVRLRRKEGARAPVATNTAAAAVPAALAASSAANHPSVSIAPTAATTTATTTDSRAGRLQQLVGADSLLASLPAWMQQVMKDMPGGGKSQTVKVDAEKAATLAKLDKLFGEGKS